MKRTIFLLCLFFSQALAGQSLHEPFAFLDSLFKVKQEYRLEMIDYKFAPEIERIMQKMQNAMAAKKEWAEEYIAKNLKEGEALPYHANLGVTKEEYEKIKDVDNLKTTAFVTDSSSFKVSRENDILYFEAGDEKASFMESIMIDLSGHTMIFIEDSLPFNKTIDAPASSPLGNWQGYSWKKESSNHKEGDELKIADLVMKIMEINFGVRRADKMTLFRLKYKEVDRGNVKANFEVLCYLK